jgi:hypothetical protein
LNPAEFDTIEACDTEYYSDCPTASMTATVKNTATPAKSLKISAVELISPDGSMTIFPGGDRCTNKTLSRNATCTITLEFQPAASAHYSSSLNIFYGGYGIPATECVYGTGWAPAPFLYPSMVNFGKKALNSDKEWEYVHIRNYARTSIEITKTMIDDLRSNPAFGADTVCEGQVLKPAAAESGNMCDMGVSFYPTDASTVGSTIYGYADVYVAHLIGDQEVEVLGTVTAADTRDIKLSESGLSFGAQTIGTTSAAKTFTITNIGVLDVTIDSIVSSDAVQFPVTNNCPATLVHGDVCTVSFTFVPATPAGPKTATITVTDNAPDAGSTQTVSLEGTAVDASQPSVTLSSNNINFGSQTIGLTSTQNVVLTNSGGAALTIGTVTATSGAFTVAEPATDCDGNTVAPGGRCKISIAYTPTAATTSTGTITISDNAPDTPQTISVKGTGTNAATPSASLSASALDFGNQTIDTSVSQTLTITNSGTSDLSISLTTIDGSDASSFAKSDGCKSTVVQPNTTCKIDVSFYPTAVNSYAATLSIDNNSSNTPIRVPLSGSGVNSSSGGGGCSLIR